MYLKFGKLKIHITFLFAAFIAFALNSEKGQALITVFAGALIHECAHLCFLLSYGERGLTLEVSPGGAKIAGGGFDALPYDKSLVCVLAGPCVNLILAATLFAASKIMNAEALNRAAQVNFMLGAMNLIPLSFLDGGRALKNIFSLKKARPIPNSWFRRADMIIVFFLFFSAVIMTLKKYDATFFLLFTVYCAVTALSHSPR